MHSLLWLNSSGFFIELSLTLKSYKSYISNECWLRVLCSRKRSFRSDKRAWNHILARISFICSICTVFDLQICVILLLYKEGSGQHRGQMNIFILCDTVEWLLWLLSYVLHEQRLLWIPWDRVIWDSYSHILRGNCVPRHVCSSFWSFIRLLVLLALRRLYLRTDKIRDHQSIHLSKVAIASLILLLPIGAFVSKGFFRGRGCQKLPT